MVMGSNDDDRQEAAIVYKTKVVQFLGRSVPIILQNDNGPCPLLAICNVLLLRNNVKLSLDTAEISLQRLLSLVAERLLDSNSNIENKDEEYVRNQQQNISDAIELLPRLKAGLDVNVRFRNIHDFEFTPECAVFDLLDIGLVHGWLCDPQDEATSKVIGANSYNTLVEKLVQLQASKAEMSAMSMDFIDFAAATTATLGVPSPSREILSKTKSFEDQEVVALADAKERKGDAEEAAQLLEALRFSKEEVSSSFTQVPAVELEGGNSENNVRAMQPFANNLEDGHAHRISNLVNSEFEQENLGEGPATPGLVDIGAQTVCNESLQPSKGIEAATSHPDIDARAMREGGSWIMRGRLTSPIQQQPVFDEDGLTVRPAKEETEFLEIQTPYFPKNSKITAAEVTTVLKDQKCVGDDGRTVEHNRLSNGNDISGSNNDVTNKASSSQENCEPLYEGENLLVEVGTSSIESREPLYEGEVILAECSDGTLPMEDKASNCETLSERSRSKLEEENLSIAVSEGMLIENFLNSHASQLTYYGLFCLQEGLKERELCVFFRNNHFSTMFKYNGDLYLLATDQGYLNQPDLVWEKLEEVHGDSVFLTGNFTLFKADQSSGLWNEQDAVAATADYLSSHPINDTGAQETGINPNYNSDLQLAMALQHQEFEQQQQQQQQQQTQTGSPAPRHSHSHGTAMVARPDGSRLITGPKRSSYTSKPDTKTKERCMIM